MDVTGGLKASARMLQEAETGVKQGAAFLQTTATQKLLPAIRSKVSTATAKGIHVSPSEVGLDVGKCVLEGQLVCQTVTFKTYQLFVYGDGKWIYTLAVQRQSAG